MINLLETIAESELNQKLTKKTVLKEVSKIRVDHSISISEQDLKIKLQLIFEECQDLTNKQFIQNCKILSKRDLFGKLPPAFKFKQPYDEPKSQGLEPYWKYYLANEGNKNKDGNV